MNDEFSRVKAAWKPPSPWMVICAGKMAKWLRSLAGGYWPQCFRQKTSYASWNIILLGLPGRRTSKFSLCWMIRLSPLENTKYFDASGAWTCDCNAPKPDRLPEELKILNSVVRILKKEEKTNHHQHCITTTIHHHNNASPQQYIPTTIHDHSNTTPQHHITTTPQHPHYHITTSPHHHITNHHISNYHITTSPHHQAPLQHISTSAHQRISTSPQQLYCGGCTKVAMVICQQTFLHFGAGDFPFKKSFQKVLIWFALAVRSGFGAAISI